MLAGGRGGKEAAVLRETTTSPLSGLSFEAIRSTWGGVLSTRTSAVLFSLQSCPWWVLKSFALPEASNVCGIGVVYFSFPFLSFLSFF